MKKHEGPSKTRPAAEAILVLAGMFLLLGSCNTEGNHSAWYLPWSEEVIPLQDPLLSGTSPVPLGGLRSLRFPDTSTRHFLLADPGNGQALELRIFSDTWIQEFNISSRRLDSRSLEQAWVDEHGYVHLPSPSGKGECLIPPTGGGSWTAISTGDPAWFYPNSTAYRFGMGSQGVLELSLNLDGYPDIAINWARLTHASDGSLVETLGSIMPQSLVLYSDGMLSLLTQAWPDQASAHTDPELQTALSDLAALGPGNIPCQVLAMRIYPHPTLGWNRPVVHVYFDIGATADPLLARPSELFELTFPAFFPGENPLVILAGEGASSLSIRVRSQATVFSDPANRPLYPLEPLKSMIQASPDGLVIGHVSRMDNRDVAWLMHWNNASGPDQDALLVLPDQASSGNLSDLPLLPDWSKQWLMPESGGKALMANRPWWEVR